MTSKPGRSGRSCLPAGFSSESFHQLTTTIAKCPSIRTGHLVSVMAFSFDSLVTNLPEYPYEARFGACQSSRSLAHLWMTRSTFSKFVRIRKPDELYPSAISVYVLLFLFLSFPFSHDHRNNRCSAHGEWPFSDVNQRHCCRSFHGPDLTHFRRPGFSTLAEGSFEDVNSGAYLTTPTDTLLSPQMSLWWHSSLALCHSSPTPSNPHYSADWFRRPPDHRIRQLIHGIGSHGWPQ